ncbi:MAG: ABC transporter substrate-binding protein [Bauldia sp.]|nr:ABC transporter substrate-binding protein [Bauldia sp.]
MLVPDDPASATVAATTAPRPAMRRAGPARTVRVGFVPLVDVAVLVAAAEQGFAEREGLRLDLVRDVSWSNIRDRLAFRQFDVAHALAPMPVASQLKLGSNPFPSFTPFMLGRGGNAITLSVPLYREMADLAGLDGSEDSLANARALRAVIDRRAAAGKPPLVLAMTYPFSSHNYEFRFWMAAGGIDPDRDVTMTIVPPPFTADAIAAGAIDGFCVNAPWNLIAVERGVGRVVATKRDIWPSSPEKVLAVRPDWAEANEETLHRLIVALDSAARWCDEPDNHGTLSDLLALPAYVGAPAVLFRTLLAGRFPIDPNGRIREIPDYLAFHRGMANFPWRSQAHWIFAQMVRWGQVPWSADGATVAAAAFRPDIYRAALGERAGPVDALRIEGDAAADGFLEGGPFDPADISAYLARFPIRSDVPVSSTDK